jgi:hypothetical protein
MQVLQVTSYKPRQSPGDKRLCSRSSPVFLLQTFLLSSYFIYFLALLKMLGDLYVSLLLLVLRNVHVTCLIASQILHFHYSISALYNLSNRYVSG